jgi:hypothetical protein
VVFDLLAASVLAMAVLTMVAIGDDSPQNVAVILQLMASVVFLSILTGSLSSLHQTAHDLMLESFPVHKVPRPANHSEA